ncbi:hypothetical protein EB796_007212 [Bugula neritina]|uniref:Uncharacterized protein n=1 Tax=Bugula neritina TaxID=10212 RepID=A0A7J7K770_BUGNE|nr:hypothetical protein EB796_007212 [Bugula neritina]
MNPQIINYGCVGNSKLLVCPHQQDGEAVHIMLNPDTVVEYDTAGYDTLRNVSMPILTKDNLVFAVNGSHASLVDLINNDSYITKLPMENPQGVHSPIYLPELDFFVIFGNFSTSHSIYKITKGINGMAELDLLTTFTVEKKGKQCPWLPMTEVTTNRNRAYFYAYQIDEIDGIVAVEFMEDHPYYKKIWEVSDEEGSQVLVSSRRHDVMADDNCTVIPQIDPDYSIFPPICISPTVMGCSVVYAMLRVREARGSVTLKIVPSYKHPSTNCEIFVKSLFNYQPETDESAGGA